MAKDAPFDDDVLTLIMGAGGPSEPGQHGRTEAPMPTTDAIGLITQIKDLCEEFLMKADKEDKPDKKEDKNEDDTEEMEEE